MVVRGDRRLEGEVLKDLDLRRMQAITEKMQKVKETEETETRG